MSAIKKIATDAYIHWAAGRNDQKKRFLNLSKRLFFKGKTAEDP
jgi:hypothetical protein